MEPDFKTQYHSLNFSLKGPIVLQQLLTGWGWGEQSQDCPLRVWVRTSNSPRSKPASPRPEGRITHGRGCRPCGARAALPASRPGSLPGYPGVVPRADARLRVQEVHLALHRGPLLCTTRWGHSQ